MFGPMMSPHRDVQGCPQLRRVLLIGGQFTGNFCARELKKQFYVTVVDCKEYFEYTPGVTLAAWCCRVAHGSKFVSHVCCG